MNQFIKAAIENMERVESDDRHREYRHEWTQAAIAYALIAIAEKLDKVALARGGELPVYTLKGD